MIDRHAPSVAPVACPSRIRRASIVAFVVMYIVRSSSYLSSHSSLATYEWAPGHTVFSAADDVHQKNDDKRRNGGFTLLTHGDECAVVSEEDVREAVSQYSTTCAHADGDRDRSSRCR